MINQFIGKYSFLSNFHSSQVVYEGLVYRSSEAAYQSAKTLDMELRKQFTLISPARAKELGKQIKLRKDWNEVKDQIMEDIVRLKFKQNPLLMGLLLETFPLTLIEGNNLSLIHI